MTNSVNLTILPSGVALITLDLPDKKVNLLSESLMRELNDRLDEVLGNSEVKGLVITSGKEDNFIAGANLDEVRALQHQTPSKSAEGARLGKMIFAKIAGAPFNTVAAIHGLSLGGGTEMTLACKFRIATNDKKTKIGLPEVQLGFLPGWGGTVRLPHIVGVQQALLLVTTGMQLDGKGAWKIGLVDEVVDRDDLMPRAERIAMDGRVNRYPRSKRTKANLSAHLGALTKPKKLIELLVGDLMETRYRTLVQGQVLGVVKSQSKGYLAPMEAAKIVLKSANEGPTAAAMEAESVAFGTLSNTNISRNLVGIFFADQESKRMLDGVEPALTVKKVGVLGAGVMGAGIAETALYSGYEVYLKDIAQEPLDKGVATIHGLINGLVDKGKLTRAEADAMLARLHPTVDYKDLADCDLVIEAVAEVMYVKKLVRAELEAVIAKPFIFATNTSSLSVVEMTRAHAKTSEKQRDLPAARHPENIIGLHFFNPAHIMPEVELVRGESSSDAALVVGKNFAMKLGKKVTLVNDRPGFIVNRILAPYMLEAIRLFEAGVPGETIDKAMRNFGMKMGPLELLDEVGLDIAAHVVNTMHGALGERMTPPALLSKLAELKLLGKKGGRGMYLWTGPDGKKVFDAKTKKYLFNPDVVAAVTAPKSPRSETEIQDRLVLAMVNEAARCMEEGIVAEPSQLDMAMIFGTGFAPFRGGPLRYADQEGLAVVAQKLTWLSQVASANYAPAASILAKAKTSEPFYRD
jgi:3-hydroxyacyl-CoA dehydrogenase/enoyl-CoA hydratase/3-hydroxybutyryl-CoA epimerase